MERIAAFGFPFSKSYTTHYRYQHYQHHNPFTPSGAYIRIVSALSLRVYYIARHYHDIQLSKFHDSKGIYRSELIIPVLDHEQMQLCPSFKQILAGQEVLHGSSGLTYM